MGVNIAIDNNADLDLPVDAAAAIATKSRLERAGFAHWPGSRYSTRT